MESIRIISNTRVCAANHKQPNLRIDLTPWDLQVLPMDHSQIGILFHKPKPSENTLNLINHLQTSLSRSLDFFLPLAGRLVVVEHDDNTTSFFIDCNNAGAEFVRATAEKVSVADIIEPTYVPEIVQSFFLFNGVRNYEGVGKPLLAVQVTELVDGIFIGCTTNHAVLDGTSLWHFFNSWSEISRGFDRPSKPLVLQRWFLHDTDCPIHINLFSNEQLCKKFIPLPYQQRVFHFSKENIARLKTKANTEIDTDKISSLQALLAHLWRSATRNQCLDPNQEVNYRLVIGARPRLAQYLPQEYFGNAMLGGTVTLKAREVLEQGLGFVAWQMNKMVATYTEKKVRNFLESYKENPELVTVDCIASNGLFTISSPRFNVYSSDFGWGRPVAVRSGAANKTHGRITLFPGAEEGSVDIEACFLPETMQKMGNDSEFIEVVTT